MDNNGLNILYWAVKGRNIQTVSYLLNLGVTITTYKLQEDVEPCEICGTHLSCYDIGGRQQSTDPYMKAVRLNMLDVMKLMDAYGCQSVKSTCTLNYAIHMENVEAVDYLLCKHKHPLNNEYIERDDMWKQGVNQTPLMKSCRADIVQVAKL